MTSHKRSASDYTVPSAKNLEVGRVHSASAGDLVTTSSTMLPSGTFGMTKVQFFGFTLDYDGDSDTLSSVAVINVFSHWHANTALSGLVNKLQHSCNKLVIFIKLQRVCWNQACCNLPCADLLQLVKTICNKPVDNNTTLLKTSLLQDANRLASGKSTFFQKKLVGQNLNIWICTSPRPPINPLDPPLRLAASCAFLPKNAKACCVSIACSGLMMI